MRGPRIKKGLPRPVTPDEAVGLAAMVAEDAHEPWIGARDRAVLLLLYGAGLRIAEALSLTAADAALGETLRVTGKGGKQRVVPVLSVVREAVDAYERAQPFVRRWGRWLTLEWRDVERAADFFRRHGEWIVFALRFSPLLRTMVSLPAGLAHMKHWKFLVFTFAGAAVWNALLIKGGHLLADYSDLVNRWAGPVVLGFLALAVGGYIWRVVTWKPTD